MLVGGGVNDRKIKQQLLGILRPSLISTLITTFQNYHIMTTETISRKEYHLKLLTKRFGNEYNISSIPSSNNVIDEYILKPKNNPSLFQATLFPMYKTRYKYKVTFSSNNSPTNNNTNSSGNGSNAVEKLSYQDLYAITFNRTNGSTPTQQTRIYKQTKAFEEQLDKLRVELQYDHDNMKK